MMLTISDNAATDVLIGRVGLDGIHATLSALGLRRTNIPGSLLAEVDSIAQCAGFAGYAELAQAAELSAEEEQRIQKLMLEAPAFDPRRAIRSTAREMATLPRLIWRDEAGPAAACGPVRQAMAHQVTRQRLALGFPRSGYQVAAKSGTLMGLIRNEIGVITLPDGQQYAVAVFTRADRQWDKEHEINAAIGAAASLAVERLRT
jgi:beta-lactamase class A